MRGRKRHPGAGVVVWTTWNAGESWWPGRVLDRPRASLPGNKLLVHMFALANCGPFLFAPADLADYLAEHKHLRARPGADLRSAVCEADHFIRTEGTPQQRAAIAAAPRTPSTSSVSPTPMPPARILPLPPPRKSSAAKPDWPNSSAPASNPSPNTSTPIIRAAAVPPKKASSPTQPNKSASSTPKAPDSRNNNMTSQKPNVPDASNAKNDTPNPFAVTAAMLTTPVPYAPALIDVMRQTTERGTDKKSVKREMKETRATLPKPPSPIDAQIPVQSANQLQAPSRKSKREAVLAKKQNSGSPGSAKTGQKTATTTTSTVVSKQKSGDAANVGTSARVTKMVLDEGDAGDRMMTSCPPNPMGDAALVQQMRNHGVNAELHEAGNSATTTSLEPRRTHHSSAAEKPMVAQPPSCMLKLHLCPPPTRTRRKRLPAPPPAEANRALDAKAKTDNGHARHRMYAEPLKKRVPQRKSLRKMWCKTDFEHERDRDEKVDGEPVRTTVATPRGSQRGSSFSETPPPAKRKRVSAHAPKLSGGGDTQMSEAAGVDERTRELIARFQNHTTQTEGMIKELMGLPMFVDTGQKGGGAECESLQKRRDAVSKEVSDLQSDRQSLEKKIVGVQGLVKKMCEDRDKLNGQVEEARRLIRDQDAAKARLSRELAEAAGSQ